MGTFDSSMWAVGVAVVAVILILVLWWLWSEDKSECRVSPCTDQSRCDLCLKRRVYVQKSQTLQVFKVDYHQIVTSMSLVPDKDGRIKVYKRNDTGENVPIFDKQVKKGQTGVIFPTNNTEVLGGTVFSVEASEEMGIDMTAVGYHA